jgi:hypothetical protein
MTISTALSPNRHNPSHPIKANYFFPPY